MAGSRSTPDSGTSGESQASEPDVAEQEMDDTEHSDESESDEADDFLDIEAEESGDDRSDHSEDYPEWLFPHFCRLPIELRHRIWDYFDPAMRAPARIFNFFVVENQRGPDEAWEGPVLEQQTAAARAVLAVHRESRAMALRFYPDEAFFRGKFGVLRCNKARDIVRLSSRRGNLVDMHSASRIGLLAGFQHLALDTPSDGFLDMPSDYPDVLAAMPDARMFYLCKDASQMLASSLKWCTRDTAYRFYIQTEEETPGVGEDLEYLFCWPKPEIEGRSDSSVPQDEENGGETEPTGEDPAVINLENGKKLVEMIQFEFESGVSRYKKIKEATLAAGEFDDNYSSSSDGESDLGTEINEYESEGIDDATIDEEGESESEDDLAVQRSSPVDEESTFGGFSPLQQDNDQSSMAKLSSLEPESPDEAPAPNRTKQSGRYVVSDSEDEDQDPPPNVQPRRAGRRVVTDSEDEDERANLKEPSRPSTRRSQVRSRVPDESSETGEGDEESSEESQDEDDEDESSEEEEQPKKLSLAERLQLFRSEVPAEQARESDSEVDEFNDDQEEFEPEEAYGGAFEDDEEGDVPSEHDELVMDPDKEGSGEDDNEW
ncbi:hypothetical protein JX266_007697 [Neoarthrinium moseri]|nr:hypothetical protein JX266_007697 [Neoarthrinium moseri]